MGGVCQAQISASREQLLRDSSRGFILKTNVWRLTWRREQREAESITQGLYAHSGSSVPRWRSQAHPGDEVNCEAVRPAAAFFLQAHGFGHEACSFQLQDRFYSITESSFEAAGPRPGPQLHRFLSKPKKVGLSWGVMSLRGQFLQKKRTCLLYLPYTVVISLGCGKTFVCVDKTAPGKMLGAI